MATNKKTGQSEQAVIVTTEHRGVFFGYLVGEPAKEKVLLQRARNCVYWDIGTRGFMGLAEQGPTTACKIGPPVPSITLWDITSVVACTPEAIDAWEKSTWAKR